MTSFLDLLEIAAARGDGLHPKLLALCESTATASQCDTVTRIDGMIQSGPDPESKISAPPRSADLRTRVISGMSESKQAT